MATIKNTYKTINTNNFSNKLDKVNEEYQKLSFYDELGNLSSSIEKLKSVIGDNFFSSLKQNICIQNKNINLLNPKDKEKVISNEKSFVILTFKNKTLKSQAYIFIDSGTVMQMADFLLGDSQGIILENRREHEKQTLTLIERSIIKQILQIFVRSVIESFNINYLDQDIDQNIYFDLALENILQEKDKLIHISLDFIWQKLNSNLNIILPYEFVYNLNTIINKQNILENQENSMSWQKKLEEIIREVELQVEAVINKKYHKTLEEVSVLKVGDTLYLGNGALINLDLFCNKVKLAQGKACEKDGQIGILLE